MKDLKENVHDMIARRRPLHIHVHIADQENTVDGLSHVQRMTVPKPKKFKVD